MEKLEKRKNIQKLINTYITNEAYGEYTDIIREIIERRYLVFDFTMDENRVQTELELFVQYLKSIRFADENDYSTMKDGTLGYYSASKKEIVLFKKRINSAEELYAVITHEIYHVLGMRERGSTALEFFIRGENTPLGTALNESFNEYGAYLAYSQNRKELENRIGVQTNGYTKITFVPRLLSAAFGIPETTIVGRGFKGRRELLEAVYRNAGALYGGDIEKLKNTYSEFERFEDNLNIFFNLEYGENTNFSDLERYKLKNAVSRGMVNYGMRQLKKMIETSIDGPYPIDEEDIKKFAYCFYKLEEINNEAFSEMRIKDVTFARVMNRRKIEGYLITDLNKIVRIKEQIDEKDYRKYTRLASEGKVDDAIDEIKEKYNIDISKSKEMLERTIEKRAAYESNFAKFMEKKDYIEGESLADRRELIIKQIEKMMGKQEVPKSFFEKIKDRLKGLFNTQKRLQSNVEVIKKERDNQDNSFMKELREMTTITRDNKETETKKKKDKDDEDKDLG